MLGSCKSDATISHFILCPKLSCLTGTYNRSLIPKISSNLLILPLNCSSSILYIALNSLYVSITGISHHNWLFCPNTTPIFLEISFRLSCGHLPKIFISPILGAIMPVNSFIVVDLPAPFGPIYPTISPCFISNDTSLIALIIFLLQENNLCITEPFPSFIE